MSKTYQKGFEDKKSASLRYLLEKRKTSNSSCSLNIESSKLLPQIIGAKPKKDNRKHGQCEKVSDDDESTISRFWLKPGLSLPKMHGTEKEHFPKQKQITTMPSADSWKLDVLSDQTVDSQEPSVATPGGCFLSNRVKSEEFPHKVIGPSLCHSSFEIDYSVITDNDLKLNDGDGVESSALKNWEKWMKIRRKQNDRFAEKLKRDKCKLVMNSGDCLREVKEEKDLLTYVQIKKTDKWRGNPKWWTGPLKLSSKGMDESYYVYETLFERGIVPPMEFVSVPDAVKQEKDVACSEYRGKINWDRLEYRKMREEQFSRQLKKMFPHKADARNLIIIGEKIKPDEEKKSPVQYDLPDITITSPDVCQQRVEEGDRSTCGIVHLVINDSDLYFGECDMQCAGEIIPIKGEHVWSLTFGAAPVGTITNEILFVENKGTVAIGYEWSRHKPSSYLTAFPARKTSSSGPHFFFNKNRGVFLPGQKTELYFHHHSKNPGYHTETWNLNLQPNIFAERDSAKVRLIAVAITRVTTTNILKIDHYLDSCMMETIVKDILWEIFERARPEIPRDIEYQSLFMEDELFEYQNKAHYYKFNTVEELKSLFQQIPLQPRQEWDLNLFTLEDLIRDYVTGEQKREMMCRLMELSRSLLRPGPSNYKFDDKRKMLYNLLCAVVETIEVQAQRIRDNFSRMSQIDYDGEFLEEERLHPITIKSGRSYVSSSMSVEAYEEGSNQSYSEDNAFKVTWKDFINYQYVLHVMFFNYLGEAAELAAGVIESCRRFEHHGEVIAEEHRSFLCNGIE